VVCGKREKQAETCRGTGAHLARVGSPDEDRASIGEKKRIDRIAEIKYEPLLGEESTAPPNAPHLRTDISRRRTKMIKGPVKRKGTHKQNTLSLRDRLLWGVSS